MYTELAFTGSSLVGCVRCNQSITKIVFEVLLPTALMGSDVDVFNLI